MADATPWESLSLEDLLKLVKKYGSRNKAAESLGVAKSTFKDHMKKLEQASLTHRAVVKPVKIAKPRSGVKRFILTAAQDSTEVNKEFLDNLLAYADWLGNCQVMISGFTYNKSLFEDHDKKGQSVYFDAAVEPYLTNDRTIIGDGMVFCGEYNRLPTTANPLSGYGAYTRDKWGVFPHAKVHLESIPRMKGHPPKIVATTGCVTKPNYIPKSAGIKAEFYHTYGAILVEVLPDGRFFPRYLLAGKDGTFYDLDRLVDNKIITTGHRVKAVVHGDIHLRKLNAVCAETVWGMDTDTYLADFNSSTLMHRLNPQYQFIHDLIDFQPRNHHNIGDPHHLYKMLVEGRESVSEEIAEAADFLAQISKSGCHTVVVNSNHDEALRKWLKTADYRKDPVNAEFFLECQLEYYRQVKEGNGNPLIFETAIRRNLLASDLEYVEFLDIDESCRLGDIEYGMHGHNGMNGSKTTPRTLSRVGPKAVTAHTHSPSTYDGLWTAGVYGELDMGYNTGLSGWAHSCVLTYQNDKHTHLFLSGDTWWA
jgi:hypothetical protein